MSILDLARGASSKEPMDNIIELLANATGRSSDALFGAMDLAYGLGGNSLLPSLLGMVGLVAAIATVLAPA